MISTTFLHDSYLMSVSNLRVKDLRREHILPVESQLKRDLDETVGAKVAGFDKHLSVLLILAQ